MLKICGRLTKYYRFNDFHCMGDFIVWAISLYGRFHCMGDFIVWVISLYG